MTIVRQTHEQENGDSSEEEIKSDLLLWTAGTRPSSLVASLDVEKDEQGRIGVDRRLQIIDAVREGGVSLTTGVYCLGDIAAVEGLNLAGNAQVWLVAITRVPFIDEMFDDHD